MSIKFTRGAHLAISNNWPEYLMEGTELALFMISSCLFVALIDLPNSLVRQAIDCSLIRRALIGLSMGLTAIAIIYSTIGKRSGTHFNPAVTLTFLRLGKITLWNAAFYMVAQFIGGCCWRLNAICSIKAQVRYFVANCIMKTIIAVFLTVDMELPLFDVEHFTLM